MKKLILIATLIISMNSYAGACSSNVDCGVGESCIKGSGDSYGMCTERHPRPTRDYDPNGNQGPKPSGSLSLIPGV